MNDVPIADVRNLGPTSAGWLRDAGVATYDDLERIGSVDAYLSVKRRRPVSIVLLWALEAALRDVHWTMIGEQDKAALRAELADREQEQAAR